jgi:hypothetical protein
MSFWARKTTSHFIPSRNQGKQYFMQQIGHQDDAYINGLFLTEIFFRFEFFCKINSVTVDVDI